MAFQNLISRSSRQALVVLIVAFFLLVWFVFFKTKINVVNINTTQKAQNFNQERKNCEFLCCNTAVF